MTIVTKQEQKGFSCFQDINMDFISMVDQLEYYYEGYIIKHVLRFLQRQQWTRILLKCFCKKFCDSNVYGNKMCQNKVKHS